MNLQKVLIFSVPFGTGHNRAAEAICKALRKTAPGIESKVVDSFSYATPVLGKFITGTYLEILKVSPRFWGFLYDRAESNLTKFSFTKVLNLLMSGKLKDLIQQEKPDVVMCTHPFPLGVLSRMRSHGKLEVPLAAVVTDFAIHSFWIYQNVDLFIVGAEELKQSLLSHGVPEAKIRVTGIPIDPAFEGLNNSEGLTNKLGLDSHLPTILIMGGGLGLGPLERTVKTMLDFPYPLQIVVIAGRNTKLESKLKAMEGLNGAKAKVFGHVDNVHEFMEIADLVVTKPGGLTSAEALAKGLPLVLMDPIPGQEKRNLDFLTGSKAAVTSADEGDIFRLVLEVLNTPGKFARMHATAKRLGKPRSAQDVARAVTDLMDYTGGVEG